jgi:hypothetical protein
LPKITNRDLGRHAVTTESATEPNVGQTLGYRARAPAPESQQTDERFAPDIAEVLDHLRFVAESHDLELAVGLLGTSDSSDE